jgi:hypothetical protein
MRRQRLEDHQAAAVGYNLLTNSNRQFRRLRGLTPRDAHLACQADRILEAFRLPRLGRMEWIAIGIERDDLETACLKRLHECSSRIGAGLHFLQIEMWRRRPASGVDLDTRNAHPCRIVEQGVKGHATQAVRYKSQFHAVLSCR